MLQVEAFLDLMMPINIHDFINGADLGRTIFDSDAVILGL